MRVKLGSDVIASVPVRSAPAVDVVAQIEDEAGSVIVAAQPATVERVPGVGQRPSVVRAVVTLPSPADAGDYCLVWRNDAAPEWTHTVPLFVVAPAEASALGVAA
jgi:hypothetical protein